VAARQLKNAHEGNRQRGLALCRRDVRKNLRQAVAGRPEQHTVLRLRPLVGLSVGEAKRGHDSHSDELAAKASDKAVT